MRKTILVTVLLVGVAWAPANYLINPGFETGAPPFGPADNWDSSARAAHADFPRPNNGSLGAYFAFLNGDPADGRKWTLQIAPVLFAPSTTWTFSGWAVDGAGDIGGRIRFQIGYLPTFDLNSFVPLSTAEYDTTQQWAPYPGTTYTTGTTGPELGKNVVVKITAVYLGTPPDDIWFDEMVLVPEPAGLALLAFASLLRRR